MRFLLGFIFGAFYTGNRAFRGCLSAHHSHHGLLSLPDVEPLGHNRRVASPGAEAAESDYCALMPSPHINCCQDAVDRGNMGEMPATLENIRVNLPSPEKYRITYWSCSGSRRAIRVPISPWELSSGCLLSEL